MTKSQKRVLSAVKILRKRSGLSPTRQEIGQYLGVRKESVQGVLQRLKRDGFVDWVSRSPRSLLTTKKGQAAS